MACNDLDAGFCESALKKDLTSFIVIILIEVNRNSFERLEGIIDCPAAFKFCLDRKRIERIGQFSFFLNKSDCDGTLGDGIEVIILIGIAYILSVRNDVVCSG